MLIPSKAAYSFIPYLIHTQGLSFELKAGPQAAPGSLHVPTLVALIFYLSQLQLSFLYSAKNQYFNAITHKFLNLNLGKSVPILLFLFKVLVKEHEVA